MNKTAFFLITALTLVLARTVFSQEAENIFFIPQAELQPRYEKLPPIPSVQSKLPSARAVYEQRHHQQVQNSQAQPAAIQSATTKKVKQYIAVDGRFIPVYEEEIITTAEQNLSKTDIMPADEQIAVIETNIAENHQQNEYFTPLPEQTSFLPADEIVFSETAEPLQPINRNTQIANNASNAVSHPQPPQTSIVDQNLPSYRNRYNQYINNLQTFQQTGQMPYNTELEKTLSKLSSSRKTVLFKGSIK